MFMSVVWTPFKPCRQSIITNQIDHISENYGGRQVIKQSEKVQMIFIRNNKLWTQCILEMYAKLKLKHNRKKMLEIRKCAEKSQNWTTTPCQHTQILEWWKAKTMKSWAKLRVWLLSFLNLTLNWHVQIIDMCDVVISIDSKWHKSKNLSGWRLLWRSGKVKGIFIF